MALRHPKACPRLLDHLVSLEAFLDKVDLGSDSPALSRTICCRWFGIEVMPPGAKKKNLLPFFGLEVMSPHEEVRFVAIVLLRNDAHPVLRITRFVAVVLPSK